MSVLEATLRGFLKELVREALREELAAASPSSPSTSGQLLTIDDVANMCRTQPKTVRAWIANGKLAARKSGRRWLVLPADVDRYLAASQPTSPNDDDAQVLRILSRRRA